MDPKQLMLPGEKKNNQPTQTKNQNTKQKTQPKLKQQKTQTNQPTRRKSTKTAWVSPRTCGHLQLLHI